MFSAVVTRVLLCMQLLPRSLQSGQDLSRKQPPSIETSGTSTCLSACGEVFRQSQAEMRLGILQFSKGT